MTRSSVIGKAMCCGSQSRAPQIGALPGTMQLKFTWSHAKAAKGATKFAFQLGIMHFPNNGSKRPQISQINAESIRLSAKICGICG